MNHLIAALPLASIAEEFNLPPHMIAIIVPIAGLIFAGVIIGMAMYFHTQRQRMWHETARLALEKGQPLPVFPEGGKAEAAVAITPAAAGPRWRSYLVAGMINLGIGAGLFFALSQIPNAGFNIGYFGAIPGCIGLALLIGAIIDAMVTARK